MWRDLMSTHIGHFKLELCLCVLCADNKRERQHCFVQFYYEWKARRKTTVEPQKFERCRQSDLSVLQQSSFNCSRQPTKISDMSNPLNGPRAEQLRVLAYFLWGHNVNPFTLPQTHECESFLIVLLKDECLCSILFSWFHSCFKQKHQSPDLWSVFPLPHSGPPTHTV